jgi:hypothetical protein
MIHVVLIIMKIIINVRWDAAGYVSDSNLKKKVLLYRKGNNHKTTIMYQCCMYDCHVCMHVFMYVCMHVHMYTYVCVCMTSYGQTPVGLRPNCTMHYM